MLPKGGSKEGKLKLAGIAHFNVLLAVGAQRVTKGNPLGLRRLHYPLSAPSVGFSSPEPDVLNVWRPAINTLRLSLLPMQPTAPA
jgi:hypothetical protein